MVETEHFLRPLLAPTSIALVGGSPRKGSVGNLMISGLVKGGYRGTVTVVNPKYDTVDGFPCVPSMTELASAPDLAVLSVASQNIEKVLNDAMETGARSAVVFDFCMLENDSPPLLLDRLKDMTRDAGFPVCGGNGMGFYNFDSKTFVSFQDPVSTKPGHITALCHSGSVFGLLADAASRYGFNLLTSQGQEICSSIADYMDYALEQPTTRVIAMFVEAIQDPERFIAALEKARRKRIPVVVTKVGRTATSARLAATHSGAMAGSDTAFDAVCNRYGVLRTDDIDSLMAAAQIFSLDKQVGDGGLAALLDSGGLREQMIDLAEDLGLNFPELSQSTTDALKQRLFFGLEAVNPLDAAGLYNENLGAILGECLHTIAKDPSVAIVAHEYYTSDTTLGVPEIAEAAKRMPVEADKPYILTTSLGTANNSRFAAEMRDYGIPVINGVKAMLTGVKCALAYRDFENHDESVSFDLNAEILAKWRTRLLQAPAPGESEVLSLLSQFGVNTSSSRVCMSQDSAAQAADQIGFPVVLKTAVTGLHHKSDIGGVHLNLNNANAVRTAYKALSKIGPEVCVAKMASAGIEIALGMVNDPQFGPVVMVSAGGTLVEILDDRAYALAPFGEKEAKRLLQNLRIWKILVGTRGNPTVNTDQLASMLSRFSIFCYELRDVVAEMDINPVIASENTVVAVDAVLVPYLSN